MINCDCSIYEFIKNAQTDGKLPVTSFRGFRLNREDFFRQVDAVAGWLQSHGFVPGDVAAVCLPNFPSAVVAIYAVNKIGGVVNVIHPLTPPMALRDKLQKLDCDFLFYFDRLCPKALEELTVWNGTTIVCSATDYLKGIEFFGMRIYNSFNDAKFLHKGAFVRYSAILRQKILPEEVKVKGESDCLYLNSGGTTGTPKTVRISNKALNEMAPFVSSLCREKQPGDSMLTVLPMFHGFGIGVCVHHSLYAGMRIVMVPAFNPKRINATIRREKVTHLCGVPNMYEKMMAQKNFKGSYLKRIKNAYSGGDALTAAVKNRFDSIVASVGGKAKLIQGYGLAETIAVCCSNRLWDDAVGSIGKPVGDNDIIVLDDKGVETAVGTVGEMAVCGSTLFNGYLEGGEPFVTHNGRKYLLTGDMAYLGEDGNYYYKGRKKRMEVVSGVNVFPSEIEELVSSINGIKNCCAIGKTVNGKRIIKLFIVLDEYAESPEAYTNIIFNKLANSLTKYSIPREIEQVDELPLTPLNKVDYKALERRG